MSTTHIDNFTNFLIIYHILDPAYNRVLLLLRPYGRYKDERYGHYTQEASCLRDLVRISSFYTYEIKYNVLNYATPNYNEREL